MAAALILMGLNWWMKPIQYHPNNPDSCFTRFIKIFIRLDAVRPPGYRPDPFTISPGATDDEFEGTTEYYQLTRSDPLSKSNKAPFDEEEIEL